MARILRDMKLRAQEKPSSPDKGVSYHVIELQTLTAELRMILKHFSLKTTGVIMKQSISRNGCAHMILKYSPKLVFQRE